MQKRILSLFLAVVIAFLSLTSSSVLAYASTTDSYFYVGSDGLYHHNDAYNKLSKSEKKKVDTEFFSQAYNNSNPQWASDIKDTSIPDLIRGIANASKMSADGLFTADLENQLEYLQTVSDSIGNAHRDDIKMGGGGMSFKVPTSGAASTGLGAVTLSKGFINSLRSNVAKFDNYTIYPDVPSDYAYYVNKCQLVYGTTLTKNLEYYFNGVNPNGGNDNNGFSQKNAFVQYYSTFEHRGKEINDTFIFSCDYWNDILYPTGSYVYYWDSDGYLCHFRFDGKSISGKEQVSFSNPWLMNPTGFKALNSYNSVFYTAYIKKDGILGRMNLYTKIYDSYADAFAYAQKCMGYSVNNYYISTEIVNNDYSTTVNKIYDYSSHDTYTTINNNITQAVSDKGSGLTDEEYQKIVDDVMKQVQEEIDSKDDTDDSGNTGGGTGGDSGNTGGSTGDDSGSSGGNESDTWLEKIFDRLGDILEKIGTVTGIDTLVSLVQQIADDVGKLKNGEAIAPDMSVTNGLLSDIAASLKTLIGVSAAGDISDLLADTVGDKISDYVGNVKNAATEMTDALQEVFPFSIPWDLMAIFGLFSAESKAPEFDIPIVVPSLGINENFHIDFSDFEYISVICRTMLGISFAVGLMWITIELTKEGD